jgi:DNA polymerase-3 subunit delta
LAQEIKKLTAFKKITGDEEIEEVSRANLDPDIFEAIDALGNRNKARALKIFHEHLAQGQSPQYLLSMVAYQFRNIASIKAGASVKLHPFVLRKTRLMAQKFKPEEIKKIYSSIFEADLSVKSGRASAEAALDKLIISI